MIMLFFLILMTFSSAQAHLCFSYLNPSVEFTFKDWPTADKYKKLNADIEDTLEKNSVASLVSLYNSFKEGYHERYNAHLESLLKNYPALNFDSLKLKKAMSDFYKIEQKVLTQFKAKILQFPAKKRMQYLRRQNLKKLKELNILLDALMGINTDSIHKQILLDLGEGDGLDPELKRSKYGDEEIWFDKNGEQQTSWSELINLVEAMDLEDGQLVADLGSGTGRLGLLIGLLRPNVSFIGLELVDIRVKWANSAARSNGFLNVHFKTENLADPNLQLPEADHFYLFNPTIPETSDILAEKLTRLSLSHPFRIYIYGGFSSSNFTKSFRSDDEPGQSFLIYTVR